MRILLTQEGLDAAANANMLRVVPDYVDPVQRFPGEVWCESSFNDLNIFGEAVDAQFDSHYGLPQFVIGKLDQFVEAKHQPPRLSSYAIPNSVDSPAPCAINWSDHLRRSKDATETFAAGKKSKGERALKSWSQLAGYRHQSSFAFLVDPYLFANDSVENVANNLERLLSEFIEPIADVPFTLLIVCKLEDPLKPDPDRLAILKKRLDQVKSNLKGKGWNREFQFHILRADRMSTFTDRIHDRYILTQQYILDSRAGFNCLTHPSTTKVDLTYHLTNHRTRDSFNIYFQELVRYVEACVDTALREQRKDGYFLSSGVLKDLPKTIRKRVKDSLGWEI